MGGWGILPIEGPPTSRPAPLLKKGPPPHGQLGPPLKRFILCASHTIIQLLLCILKNRGCGDGHAPMQCIVV